MASPDAIAHSDAMISFRNIAIRRGPRLLFEDLSEQLHPGERIGLVGDNGSGKSSLFALIQGDLHADHGDWRMPSDWVMAHVAQESPTGVQPAIEFVLDGDAELRALEQELSKIDHARESARGADLLARMEQIDGYGARARAAKLLHGLGFPQQTHLNPLSDFSGGWRVRLGLARALMCRSDLLLLDEPTNHLDLDAVAWLEDWLGNYPGTLLLISHDREFLDGICRRILHIENQRVRSYSGNYSRFEQTRAEALAAEQASFRHQQRTVAHLENYIRRFRAKATKARQAQSRIKALERMQHIAPAHVDSPFSFDFMVPDRASDPLLKLEDVSAGYGGNPVLNSVGFSIEGQDRIALVGPNGAGKSTLIKLLAGEISLLGGDITRAKGLKTGYFAQHQLEQLDPGDTPLGHMSRAFPEALPQALRNFLGGFGFRGDRVNDPVAPFSGGEKARLALALLIHRGPNLLLMDEPTNHLDLEMRHALTLAFQNYRGAIVLVSHDRHLIRTVSDSLWLVHGGGVSEFTEDMDGYLAWARQQRQKDEDISEAGEDGGRASSSRKARRQESARRREQVAPLRRQIRDLDKQMDKTRKRAMELDAILHDPQTYENEATADLARMMQDKTRLEEEISDLEERWLTLSEELETLEEDA